MPQDDRYFKASQLGRWILLLGIGILGLGGLGLMIRTRALGLDAIAQNTPFPDRKSSLIESPITPPFAAEMTTYDLPEATVRVVFFPQTANISVAVADDLAPISAFADHGTNLGMPVSIINGGFFDPQNGKTTSHLVVNGEVVGDPADNERLVDNLDLQQYLPQILNRSEFRTYRCEATTAVDGALHHDITFHDAAIPEGCELENSIGAGPQLLPEDTSEREAFTAYIEGEQVRDAIGGALPNARSAVGLDSDGAVYFIMVEKTANRPGFTLAEVSEFAASIGVEKLLNLDGGSSSSLYMNTQTFYGRVDANGNPLERPVKSVILAQ